MSTNTQRPGTNLIHVGLLLVVVGIVLAVATLAAGGNAVLGLVSALGLLLAGVGFGQCILAALEK